MSLHRLSRPVWHPFPFLAIVPPLQKFSLSSQRISGWGLPKVFSLAYTKYIAPVLVHVNNTENTTYMSRMEETRISNDDLAHLVRLALAGKPKDVQLFVRRLINRYRLEVPELADQL